MTYSTAVIRERATRLSLAILAATALLLTLAVPVSADGKDSPQACGGAQTVQGNQNQLNFAAAAGETVNGVCIKSGNNMFGGTGHSDVLGNGTFDNGCYTVSGVGTSTVTVTRSGSASSTCQGLSHIDVITSGGRTDGGGNGGNGRNGGAVTLCHATGSPVNPFVIVSVSESAAEAHRAHGDEAPNAAGVCAADDARPDGRTGPTAPTGPNGLTGPTGPSASTGPTGGGPGRPVAPAAPVRGSVLRSIGGPSQLPNTALPADVPVALYGGALFLTGALVTGVTRIAGRR